MGDELFSMMVAESVPNSDILGPMFLPQLAHNVMLRFVNKPALSEALVVLGPPKSSKTAVLYDVLPRMVAARVGGLDPVFVRLTFSLANSPQSAAKRIWTELRAVAHAFSICETVVPAEVSLDDAILYLPKLVEEISKWCENKNGTEKRQLLLLMDEVSVRLYIISLVAFLHWIAHFFPTLGFFSAMFCRHLF